MYEWLIFLHIAAVLAFMVAHGAHITAMWRMRAEADPTISLTLLNAVSSALPVRILLAVVVGTGVLAGFMGSWWTRGWIWTSIAVLVVIWVTMWRYAGNYYGLVEDAAARAIEARASDATNGSAQQEFDAARRGWQTIAMTVIGFGGLAIILWLMMFKPF
jgi:hypothetical protein